MGNKERIKKLFEKIDETDQIMMGLFIGLNIEFMMLELDEKGNMKADSGEKTGGSQLAEDALLDLKKHIFELGRQSDIQRAAINELKTLVGC